MIIDGYQILALLAGAKLYHRDKDEFDNPVRLVPKPIRGVRITRQNLEDFKKQLEIVLQPHYASAYREQNRMEVSYPSNEDKSYWSSFAKMNTDGSFTILSSNQKLWGIYYGVILARNASTATIKKAAKFVNVKEL